MRKLLTLAAIAAVTLGSASPSLANLVTFQISEIGAPWSIMFTVDQSPVPDHYDDYTFTLIDVDVSGYSENLGILFSTQDLILGGTTHFAVDPAYFTGTTSSPSFLTGSYHLVLRGPPRDPPHYTMTISAASPVPEPATWAMMLLGFASIGLAFRRNRKMIRGSAALS
jgi:hypothetical protein